jgi:hypothetical protein
MIVSPLNYRAAMTTAGAAGTGVGTACWTAIAFDAAPVSDGIGMLSVQPLLVSSSPPTSFGARAIGGPATTGTSSVATTVPSVRTA